MGTKALTTEELVKLLGDIDGQQKLYAEAKSGQSQAMLDFVRFAVLKKISETNPTKTMEEKISLFETIMSIVKLEVEDLK